MLDDISSAYDLSNRSDVQVAEANRLAIASAKTLTSSRQTLENTSALAKQRSDKQSDYFGEGKDALAGFGAAKFMHGDLVKGVRNAGSLSGYASGELDRVVKANSGGMGLGQIVEGARQTFGRPASRYGGAAAEQEGTELQEIDPTTTAARGSTPAAMLANRGEADTFESATGVDASDSSSLTMRMAMNRIRSNNGPRQFQSTAVGDALNEGDITGVQRFTKADGVQPAEAAESAAADAGGNAAATTASEFSAEDLAKITTKFGPGALDAGEAAAKTASKFGAMDALGVLPGAIDASQDLFNTKNGKWSPTVAGDNWQEKASNVIGITSTVMDFVPGLEWAGAAGNLVSAGLGAWGEAKDQSSIGTKDAASTVAATKPNLQAGLNFHAMGMVANQSNNSMNSIHSSTSTF